MARPRQGVTLRNANHVYGYFQEVLSDYMRSLKVLSDIHARHSAEKSLIQIPQIQYCDLESRQKAVIALKRDTKSQIRQDMLKTAEAGETTPDPEQLDAWVRKFVSKKGWTLCQNNLRQSRHAASAGKSKTQIKIDRSTAYALKSLAEERGQSIDALLLTLIEKERGC